MNPKDLKQHHQSTLSQDSPPPHQSSGSNGDIIDRAIAESSDDSFAEEHSASPRGKKQMICDTFLFFLPTVMELGFIGYGVGLCCTGKTAQGATIIGIFFCFLIATAIGQYYFYKQDGCPFRQNSSNSEENIEVQESNTPRS